MTETLKMSHVQQTMPFYFQVKVSLYTHWVASENIETQRNGILSIFMLSLDNMPTSSDWFADCPYVVKGLPVRSAAAHICLPDAIASRIIGAQISIAMQTYMGRIQIHLGRYHKQIYLINQL